MYRFKFSIYNHLHSTVIITQKKAKTQERSAKNMEVKEFFATLKQHCEKNGICEQCCLRLFCHIAPTAINDKIIDDVCLYINQSVEDITSHGTRGELHSNPSHPQYYAG